MTRDDEIFIVNILRRGTIRWGGRRECLRRARKRVLEGYSNKKVPIYKYHWQCAKCSTWYRNEKDVEIDHIIEIGPYNGNWDEYIRRVYCGQDNLQALCTGCHLKKTQAYSNARARYKRK